MYEFKLLVKHPDLKPDPCQRFYRFSIQCGHNLLF